MLVGVQLPRRAFDESDPGMFSPHAMALHIRDKPVSSPLVGGSLLPMILHANHMVSGKASDVEVYDLIILQ